MPDFHLDNGTEFFIGANTCSGFIFCAEDDLRALGRVHIVKGGPGTGKSTLLKSIAEAARSRNEPVTVYRCSSDPSSVDAVILPRRSTGFVDGTSPHVYEGKCVGAVESIIDTAEFLGFELLQTKKEQIKRLNEEKSRLFASAYRYLFAASSVVREEEALSESFYLVNKARAAIRRILKEHEGGKSFEVTKKQTLAFDSEGETRLNTFSVLAEVSYTVADFHGIAPLFIRDVLAEAEKMGIRVWVSCDQYLRPRELFLPDGKVAFVCENGSKSVNCQRFADPDAYRRERQKIKLHKELRSGIEELAVRAVKEARCSHLELEDIYKEAMDLPALSDVTAAFVKELFK